MRGVIVVSPRGVVQFATDRATAWLKKVFGLSAPSKRLPRSIVRWLEHSSEHGQQKAFVAPAKGGRALRIDILYREASSLCLLLEQAPLHRSNVPPQGRPLTSRETEVLSWVAQGKSNAEIAAILDVRTKTVDKHLERIYPKLGVENRTAAASHATAVAMN